MLTILTAVGNILLKFKPTDGMNFFYNLCRICLEEEQPHLQMRWNGALAELINHPDLMERARHEIDSIVGKDRLVEASDITNLPYIEAIGRETLRLHPAGPIISRESIADCTIGGYHIPSGTQLLVSVWAIGRDPNSWENPIEFRPERFLNEDGGINRRLNVRGQQFQLLPFGSG